MVREGEAPGRFWLTGFDGPCCHTMDVDKPMAGHNLMEPIARKLDRDLPQCRKGRREAQRWIH